MKRLILLFTVITMVATLSGCAENSEYLERKCSDLRKEISILEEQKSAVEHEIVAAKVDNGTAKYVITFCIKQSHLTLDIGEHIKDSMNEITLDVPVDKEYYDALSVGDTINDDFRMGSLIMKGSFGNWNVTVSGKEIR